MENQNKIFRTEKIKLYAEKSKPTTSFDFAIHHQIQQKLITLQNQIDNEIFQPK